MRRICVVVLFFAYSLPGWGQQLTWSVLDDPDQVAAILTLPDDASDTTFRLTMNTILQELHYQGYLTASYGLDPISDTTAIGILYIGGAYTWATLSAGDVPEIILSQGNYRAKNFKDQPFDLRALQKLFDQVIDYSENHGFPFAAVWLDSVSISGGDITANLAYDAGTAIAFDSVALQGYTEIHEPWLMSYLEIMPGSEFSQQAVNYIPQRIRRLPFARLTGAPAITFQNESAKIYLPLEKVASNRVDGVVGFLPNEEDDGGIRITGQLDLSLTNLFNSGKRLDIAWQRVKPLSQTLSIRYRHPNVLRSPIHFDGGFELLKEDSTFINRHLSLALTFIKGTHEIGLFTRFKSSRLLATGQYEGASTLPEFSDQNVNYYGIAYNAFQLDDGWGDNKGWSVNIQGALGDKKIRRNADLPESLYENIDMETLQVTAELEAKWGIQLGKKSLLYMRVHSGFVEDDQLFQNDLFRLGGLRTLRGFAENNFYVSSFATGTIEYQLFFEAFSYLFFFADQGVLKNKVTETPVDYPTGFGLGMNLRTGGGDLQLAFALGRTRDQPVNFSLSKFHFGYIAKF